MAQCASLIAPYALRANRLSLPGLTRQSILFARSFYEDDRPPEIGFTRFRALQVRKSDKSDLRWSSPRVTRYSLIGRYPASCGYSPALPLRQSSSHFRPTSQPSSRSFSENSRLRSNLDAYCRSSAVFSFILIVRTVTCLWSLPKSG